MKELLLQKYLLIKKKISILKHLLISVHLEDPKINCFLKARLWLFTRQVLFYFSPINCTYYTELN